MTKNHIAEWYGHRVFPVVASTQQALTDQQDRRCPFLSEALAADQVCVKPSNSQGVCTVSSSSNGTRQDWLVCPFRVIDHNILTSVTRKLFGYTEGVPILVLAASVLQHSTGRNQVIQALADGKPTVVHFQSKLGGEISISKTDRSPELAFDATLAELVPGENGPRLGRYGIFEVQTMDYHGSYKHAVEAVRSALDLHGSQFHTVLKHNTDWLSRKMEGPNIANVFKRTFYQMMFKFQIGAHGSCAGCALAIPKAVWDSWQRHLGAPELVDNGDGTHSLATDEKTADPHTKPAWIYVFDVDVSAEKSPNQLTLWRVIATEAAAVSQYALEVAPASALEEQGSVDRVLDTIRGRLAQYMDLGN